MDKYGIDKSANISSFNVLYPESYEQQEAFLDADSYEHDANFRDRFTQALRAGFLAYIEIISGEREVENFYFEIYLQREALKMVRAYHSEVIGSIVFGGPSASDFYTYIEQSFGLDKHEMSVEGAIIDFAYELYQIQFEGPFGNETLEWLINSIDS